jgi:hypothetical protein
LSLFLPASGSYDRILQNRLQLGDAIMHATHRRTDSVQSLTLPPRAGQVSSNAANDSAHAEDASKVRPRGVPNPLWVITIGMAAFFAMGAAIIAFG